MGTVKMLLRAACVMVLCAVLLHNPAHARTSTSEGDAVTNVLAAEAGADPKPIVRAKTKSSVRGPFAYFAAEDLKSSNMDKLRQNARLMIEKGGGTPVQQMAAAFQNRFALLEQKTKLHVHSTVATLAEDSVDLSTELALDQNLKAGTVTCTGCSTSSSSISADAKLGAAISNWANGLSISATVGVGTVVTISSRKFKVLAYKKPPIIGGANFGPFGSLIAPAVILRETTQANGKNDVWVVHRGSESLGDWAFDLAFAGHACKISGTNCGTTHWGFTLLWDHIGIVDALIPLIGSSSIPNSPKPTVKFTGHSLGGALTVLAALEFKIRSSSANTPLVFTFGCPRVGDATFAGLVKSKTKHYRFRNANDPVPMVPVYGTKKISIKTVVPFVTTDLNVPFRYSHGSNSAYGLKSTSSCACFSDSNQDWSFKVSDHYMSNYLTKVNLLR